MHKTQVLYALIIALVATAVVIMGIVNEPHVVFKYDGPTYTVEYLKVMYPLLPSINLNPAPLFPMVNFRINGLPNNTVGPVSIYLSGPGTSGFVSIGTFTSKYRAFAVNVSGYVPIADELIDKLGYSRFVSGPSILAFITVVVNGSGTYYALTDVIAIPVIPRLAQGSEVLVYVNFTPFIITKIPSNTASNRLSLSAMSSQGPPSSFGNCGFYGWCVEWKLVGTLYQGSNVPVPIVVTYIAPANGYWPDSAQYVLYTQSSAQIALSTSQSTYLSISMGMAIPMLSGKPAVNVPGPGFTVQLSQGQSSQTLLSFSCTFDDSLNTQAQSACAYSGQSSTSLPDFGAGGALASINVYGTAYIVQYDEYKCFSFLGVVSCSSTPINESFAGWFVPNYNSQVGQWQAGGFIDTNPGAEQTWLSQLVYNLVNNGVLTGESLSQASGDYYHLSSYDVVTSAGSSSKFAISIPLGGLACAFSHELCVDYPVIEYTSVGISLNSISAVSYSYYLASSTGITSSVYFCPVYYELSQEVYISQLGEYYPAPMMIVAPTPALYCLSIPNPNPLITITNSTSIK